MFVPLVKFKFIWSTCLYIQAYIATLLGRLEANEGKFWSLLVKINDGTATMDVTISDQVCLLTVMVQ